MGRPRKLKFKSMVQAKPGDVCFCGKTADFRVEFTPKTKKDRYAGRFIPYLVDERQALRLSNQNNCVCESCFKDRFLTV